jgi:hypothetical protein
MGPKNFDCYEKPYAQYALNPIECLKQDPRGYLQYVFYCEEMDYLENKIKFNLQRIEFLEAETERRIIQNIEGENRKMRTVMNDCFMEIRSIGEVLQGRGLDSPENQRIRQVQARRELEAQERRRVDDAEQERLKLKLEAIRVAKYQELTPGVTYISDIADVLEDGEIVAPVYEEVIELVPEVIAKLPEVIEQLPTITVSIAQNDLISDVFKQFLMIEKNLYFFCKWAYRKICYIFK